MYGAAMGSLYLEISVDNGSSWHIVWSRSGTAGLVWNHEDIDLSDYVGGAFWLRFRGVTGTSFTSDMAIDQLEFAFWGD